MKLWFVLKGAELYLREAVDVELEFLESSYVSDLKGLVVHEGLFRGVSARSDIKDVFHSGKKLFPSERLADVMPGLDTSAPFVLELRSDARETAAVTSEAPEKHQRGSFGKPPPSGGAVSSAARTGMATEVAASLDHARQAPVVKPQSYPEDDSDFSSVHHVLRKLTIFLNSRCSPGGKHIAPVKLDLSYRGLDEYGALELFTYFEGLLKDTLKGTGKARGKSLSKLELAVGEPQERATLVLTAVKVIDLSANTVGHQGAVHISRLLLLHLAPAVAGGNSVAAGGAGGDKNRTARKAARSTALSPGALISPRIVELALGWNKLLSAGVFHIAKALEWPFVCLQVLDLQSNLMGNEGCKYIAAALCINTCLTNLNLSDNEIGPEGAKQLAHALHINVTLNSLMLSNNELRDAILDFGDMLGLYNSTLIDVDFSNNRISDVSGAGFVEKAFPNTSMLTCALWENKIGLHTLERLQQDVLRRNLTIKRGGGSVAPSASSPNVRPTQPKSVRTGRKADIQEERRPEGDSGDFLEESPTPSRVCFGPDTAPVAVAAASLGVLSGEPQSDSDETSYYSPTGDELAAWRGLRTGDVFPPEPSSVVQEAAAAVPTGSAGVGTVAADGAGKSEGKGEGLAIGASGFGLPGALPPLPAGSSVSFEEFLRRRAVYRAVGSYRHQLDDEVSLREGETVTITEEFADGWGMAEKKTGHWGVVPLTQLEKVEDE